MTDYSIASRIRAARKRAGYSQDQVAQHLGVDRTAVVKWESSKPTQAVKPERDRVLALAQCLQVSVDWLLDDTQSPHNLPPEIGSPVQMRDTPEQSALTFGQTARVWWDEASTVLRQRRRDLKSRSIWTPDRPDWQKPLVPDIVTDRAAVQLLAMPRPYYYQFVHRLALLHAFDVTESNHRRLAAFWWSPEEVAVPTSFRPLLPAFQDVVDRVTDLAPRLGVQFYCVSSRDEAVEYLSQIL